MLASLWSVSDRSTSAFMQTFYRFRGTTPGVSTASALQSTQLAFLRGQSGSSRWAHPFHWSGFVLLGGWQ